MIVNNRWGILQNTTFVWIMVIALSLTCRADVQAAPAKTVKPSATQREVKQDTGEWKKVLEAAKKEGKIVISGAPGAGWRKSQVDMFQQEYPEITVEFSASDGRNFWAALRQEREFGKKLWDLRSGGAEPLLIAAKRDGFLVPVRPLLLPEIADDSKWIGGIDGLFADKEKKYTFGYTLYAQPSAYVNRDFIKESELKSSEQLLDPKFSGKIVIQTPTGGSTLRSLGHMAFMYGRNFIRDLLSKQNVIVTDDDRQQVEWVVRGRYPIAIGFGTPLLATFVKQGLGRNVVKLEDKIIRLTNGFGAISLLEGAPHPNAARVYINWLLSQKTQIMLTKNVQTNSARIDVPPVDVESTIDLAKLSQYHNGGTEEISEFNNSLLPMIKEALKQ